MNNSMQVPGRVCEPGDGEPPNPNTTVTGDAGCEEMMIKASEVIEECLSKGNYEAKPIDVSETNHKQQSTSIGYNNFDKSVDDTSVEMEIPSTELQNIPSVSLQIQTNNDQLMLETSGNITEISNISDRTLLDKEGLPFPNNLLMLKPDSLEPGFDQLSVLSGNSEELSEKSALKSIGTSLSILSNRTNSNDMLKQALVRSTIEANSVPTPSKVEIFTPDTGLKWHDVQNNCVTPRLITQNLPEAFKSLPICGQPGSHETLEDLQNEKIREFVGCDLSNVEYTRLLDYCSPDNAMTGKELSMTSPIPMPIPQPGDIDAMQGYCAEHSDSNLCIVHKHKLREGRKMDSNNFVKRLKYRGIRLMPLNLHEVDPDVSKLAEDQLEPGKDMLFHIRIYRPFHYNVYCKHGSRSATRHSIFSRDAVMTGRSPLHALRASMVCPNDVDARHDVANALDTVTPSGTTAGELFPSGFMFINNVFYVDERPGCKDMSAVIREWAVKRGMGKFEKRPMTVKMQDVPIRLCHPELYVHQGNCEHIFTISQVRLVNATDPVHLAHYPCYTALSQHNAVYCTTCAEYCARWIVVGSDRVPFDPAFFCDMCLKHYLYKNKQPVEEFKVFAYGSNESSKIHII